MELQIHETAQKWKRVLEQERKTGSVDDIDWVDVVAGYNAGCDMPFGVSILTLCMRQQKADVVYLIRTSTRSWRMPFPMLKSSSPIATKTSGGGA